MGATIATSTSAGGLISSNRMLRPWPKKSALPAGQVRRDRLGVDLALRGVRRQHHDHVGPGGRLGRRDHPQALLLGLGPALRALLQADHHVDARVAQRQRVRVALAAVPDHGDLASLDDGQVGVVVVEHLRGHALSFQCGDPAVVARGVRREVRRARRAGPVVMEREPRPMATRPGLHHLLDAVRLEVAQQRVQLVGVPVASIVRVSGATSTTFARNSSTVSSTCVRTARSARTLTSSSSRWTDCGRVQLDDLQDVRPAC